VFGVSSRALFLGSRNRLTTSTARFNPTLSDLTASLFSLSLAFFPGSRSDFGFALGLAWEIDRVSFSIESPDSASESSRVSLYVRDFKLACNRLRCRLSLCSRVSLLLSPLCRLFGLPVRLRKPFFLRRARMMPAPPLSNITESYETEIYWLCVVGRTEAVSGDRISLKRATIIQTPISQPEV